jgi:hypothetical protein
VTTQAVEKPARRFSRLAGQPGYLAFALLLVAGVALRVWLMFGWRPGFLGWWDTRVYLEQAAGGSLFADAMHTAGYVVWLRGVNAVTSNLSVVAVLQHALGVGAAVLLWAAVRRTTGSLWAPLLPAAVVLFEGTTLFLEHSVLSESPFIFLQACTVYALVRSLDADSLPWAALAGLGAALSTLMRLGGGYLVVAVLLAVLLERPTWRRRGLALAATAACALVPIAGYAAAHDASTGQFGLTRASSWNFYGRVAPFADCTRFSPPRGTDVLCESKPPSRRYGPFSHIFGGDSPGVIYLGGPYGPHSGTDKVNSFARQAVLNQPLDYLGAIGTDVRRYVAPDCCNRPGFGESADSLLDKFLLLKVPLDLQPDWSSSGYAVNGGSMDTLVWIERRTRLDGVWFVLLALGALAGPLLARGGRRTYALMWSGLAALALLAPLATFQYDARIVTPAFGLLAAAAAQALHELSVRRAAKRARLRAERRAAW